jgi:hypothetical protein
MKNHEREQGYTRQTMEGLGFYILIAGWQCFIGCIENALFLVGSYTTVKINKQILGIA